MYKFAHYGKKPNSFWGMNAFWRDVKPSRKIPFASQIHSGWRTIKRVPLVARRAGVVQLQISPEEADRRGGGVFILFFCARRHVAVAVLYNIKTVSPFFLYRIIVPTVVNSIAEETAAMAGQTDETRHGRMDETDRTGKNIAVSSYQPVRTSARLVYSCRWLVDVPSGRPVWGRSPRYLCLPAADLSCLIN